jgi:hypothetical protein
MNKDRNSGVMSWGIFTLLVCASAKTLAHHSTAAFDTETEITIAGTVVDYDWSNPHVYVWVEDKTEDGESITWEVEGSPPSILRRIGVNRDLISIGERVSITGNPGRSPDRPTLLMGTLEEADGDQATLSQSGALGVLMQESPEVGVSTDTIEGTWGATLNMEVALKFISPELLSLTERGEQAIASYSEADTLLNMICVPATAPAMMMAPDIKEIEIQDDVVYLRREWDGVERTIYLDVDSHDQAGESIHGHSIGSWEGDALIIDTTNFSPHPTGNTGRLPSGRSKHLIERLELNEDGTRLLYSFVLEDPEYLQEPVTGDNVEWLYRPDLSYEPAPCTEENARRSLQ